MLKEVHLRNRFGHRPMRHLISLAILLLFLLDASQVIRFNLLHQLELIAYDARTLLTLQGTPFPGVVIVDIDEASLEREGRWPWNRDKLAALVTKMTDEYQVAAIGFDVVFAERDESSGLTVLNALAQGALKHNPGYQRILQQLRPNLDRDALFQSSLAGRPVILGYYFTSSAQGEKTHTSGKLPAPFSKRSSVTASNRFVMANGYGANLPELQDSSAGGGHFNPFIDPDGKIRRIPMFIEYAGNLYPSLSLSMVKQVLGIEQVELRAPPSNQGRYSEVESIALGGMSIPVDSHLCALVPFRGKARTFQYFSASDVLHGRVSKDQLQDSIVLVGTTAIGLLDQRPTPVSNAYPGVEIHANMIAGILEQNIRHEPAYVMGMEVIGLLASGLLLMLLLPRASPFRATMLTLAVSLVMIGVNLWAWQQQHMLLPLAPPLLLVASLYLFHMSYGFFVESRAKREISNLFGQYVPPELVKEMSRNPEHLDMKSENREMSVLFSDIRDFTTISEKLPPEDLSSLLNIYLTRMSEIIHKHRGTVDKYIGDAIMAFWGAPLRDPDHAAHAVAAALEMQQAMEELRASFSQRGWPALHIGIGINTGTMSVGNMGSRFRKAYTVLGDAVNLSSRLESLTKFYGVDILIGEDTARAVPDFDCREVDCARVKGKGQSVKIYVPRLKNSRKPAEETENEEKFHSVLLHFRQREWDKAETLLHELQAHAPDCRLCQIYLERIARFREVPPEESWDGAFEFRMK